ncbi:MAG: hypothetical protein KF734_15110 [Saprospiraceae bacterium]|nr:hypothetical protein [Saprospiraceae bacterium]
MMNTTRNTSLTYWLAFQIALWVGNGCGTSPQANQKPEQAKAHAAAATFQFSKAPPITHNDHASNWCNEQFTDAVLVSADPANVNRRIFVLGEGIYRVAVQAGNMASLFLLQKSGEHKVELFTSDNFPLCLSFRKSFGMAPDNAWFNYDNERGIAYTVEAQPTDNGLYIIIVLPPTPTYGLNVHRCVGCQ